MRKLPIPALPTTAYMTKTRKQRKTNEEKQAKKKELHRVKGRDLEVVLVQIFKLSPLSSQSYRLQL